MNQIVNNLNQSVTAPLGGFDSLDLLGKIGNLRVRLARTDTEVLAAQKVRFDVFHAELGSHIDSRSQSTYVDDDEFDAHCDHLIVLDRSIPGADVEQIVGTYRLMRSHQAREVGGFYSASEFHVAGLVARNSDRTFMELGRSCVIPRYRSKRTIELLWQGIWAYTRKYNIDVMMGCASFAGVIPARHAQALSFLRSHALASGEWSITPLAGRHVSMDLVPEEAVDMRAALAEMPPLVKGYLRLGAKFGDGAVIDHAFNTTDVMVVLPVENISSRYRAYYGENAERFA